MLFLMNARIFSCRDRKSTRLNSSHLVISYAVFCLKKKMQWPLDQQAEDRVDFAQASQGGGEQQPHEGAVARVERGERVVPRQGLVFLFELVGARDELYSCPTRRSSD